MTAGRVRPYPFRHHPLSGRDRDASRFSSAQRQHVPAITDHEEIDVQRTFATLMTAALLSQSVKAEEAEMQANHPYVGLWVTEDSYIRHELLPNGRYVEARGTRERAYEGRYQVTGTHIDYWDDTGFTADGDFIDGVLHHAGMIFHRGRRTGKP
ncbi:hypothetical protein CN116_24965 [Sinorhizobium meliloti]|nr:hypothetical protein CN125_29805 [Sinorhizobium meliloti]RVM39886.1 hypothetical protein CN121_32085 [Sinorhizobium meliloti]RVM58020.1 hypothetical protein CN124_29020 [Sinorhizobium meliloti]RVM62618.1 hypothetical protein CN123_27120 [Sinorhizobium meliloti]RVM79092.1 hypothetical protein CN117_27000 [Sinorhizobium meliloti]